MSEHTPTTEEIETLFVSALIAAAPDDVPIHPVAEEARRSWAAWLAAHDAEVLRAAATELEQSIDHLDPSHPGELSFINCTRIDASLLRERAERAEAGAGVVAAELLREFTFMGPGPHDHDDDYAGLPTTSLEQALDIARQFPGKGQVFERIVYKDGPWVPVKQEGATS